MTTLPGYCKSKENKKGRGSWHTVKVKEMLHQLRSQNPLTLFCYRQTLSGLLSFNLVVIF